MGTGLTKNFDTPYEGTHLPEGGRGAQKIFGWGVPLGL